MSRPKHKKFRLKFAPRQQRRQSNHLKPVVVREVWENNVAAEFKIIRGVIQRYSFVSMDTEFPGVIFLPMQTPYGMHPSDYYQVMKANVDALNIIQVGLTFSDSDGNLPDLGTESCYIWQFNFMDFNPSCDIHNPDSIALLHRQGIDFNRNCTEGIDSAVFAQLMIRSRLLCNESVSWVTFQSAYDFGYLVKILTCKRLPQGLDEFLEVLRVLFGDKVYDIKHIMRFCNDLYGGLERVAKALEVDRTVGKCHQAGSDSLLTWYAFKKLCDVYFPGNGPVKHAGVVYGLEVNYCNQEF